MNVLVALLLVACLVPICSSRKFRFLREGHSPFSAEVRKERPTAGDGSPLVAKKNKVIKLVDDDDRRRSVGRKSHRSRHQASGLPGGLGLLVPGHALIRPARTMLKSAVQFPTEDKNLIYGNLRNLAITLGKTKQRAMFGGFRKTNDFLGTLVKAIKEIDREERNIKSPSVIVLQPNSKPKFKSKTKPLIGNKLSEITEQLLDVLESKGPNEIEPKLKPPKVEQLAPSVYLVKPQSKTKPAKSNRFKEITMKAVDFLDNTEPQSTNTGKNPLQTKPNSQASIASTLQEITMKALNFLDNGNQKTDHAIPKSKSSIGNTLTDLTFKALNLLDNKDTTSGQQKQNILPIIGNKFKEAVKSLKYLDGSNLVTFLKLAKMLVENENNKKGKSVIVLGSKPQAKSKLSMGDKLSDITMKVLDFLNNMNYASDRGQKSRQSKLKRKKQLQKEQQSQDLLNKKSHIEFDTNPRKDELLKERTKKIQDFLNSHIPVINTQPLKELSAGDLSKKVQEFLSNQVPIRGAKDTVSLKEKTKNIQDFLNNQVPIFLDRDSLSDRNKSAVSLFHVLNANSRRQEQIDEDENNANEILDLDSSDEEPNYRRSVKKKKRKFRNRDSKYDSHEDSESGVSASSDYEKNPGNPFTIHRNKYIQNWMWNHVMDGDHMNINPFGPPFASLGPSGADLFFGRKWWYFNQDDYKPMG